MAWKSALKRNAGVLLLSLTAIGGFEGVRTVAYLDPVGIPTICFGSTQGVAIGQTATMEECNALLEKEVLHFQDIVLKHTQTEISPHELVAYTSFVYNVGEGAFKTSTLLKKLNAGDRLGACNELPRWVYAKGITLPGLVTRRNEEKLLCLSGVSFVWYSAQDGAMPYTGPAWSPVLWATAALPPLRGWPSIAPAWQGVGGDSQCAGGLYRGRCGGRLAGGAPLWRAH